MTRIVQWRKDVPMRSRSPLLDSLWKDGLLYFVFMIRGCFAYRLICMHIDLDTVLGALNLALVLQDSVCPLSKFDCSPF